MYHPECVKVSVICKARNLSVDAIVHVSGFLGQSGKACKSHRSDWLNTKTQPDPLPVNTWYQISSSRSFEYNDVY